MTRERWIALAERCEKATGPDREIDAAIFLAINPAFSAPEWKLYGGGFRHIYDSSDARILPPASHTPGRYTASLDAITALIQKELPEHDYTSGHTNGGLTIHAQCGSTEYRYAETEPLARCAAFCRAKAELAQ
jgi:hypothetical protein